ncbi:hypothetical protein FGE12_10900 [Aggregicoccus sp. 17bor-14]|uniref:hypothetical protein n=1 Tax=Myxococcaceae TaxID=31 RepID=UPI00129CC58F|nr:MULTISPECIES: hypothetical protein [Myxococcaceae]MBF5042896.1 hypothetical protein [Simulacricoccus sp. 17bor-14]MRI88663.1 hypothetical protein [Aggregicoccus sp. 17bor-14]
MSSSRSRALALRRALAWPAVFSLGALAGALLARASGGRSQGAPRSAPRRAKARRGARRGAVGWDIAPGESLMANGERDVVLEASLESFPASDPPALTVAPEA